MKKIITPSQIEWQSESAVSTLAQFITEMNLWEVQCSNELKKIDLATADLKTKLSKDIESMDKIFSKYCTSRKRTSNHAGVYSDPPEYDPNTEKITEVVFESKKKAVIYTRKEAGLKFTFRYTLLQIEDRWLIDCRERLGLNGKWMKGIL